MNPYFNMSGIGGLNNILSPLTLNSTVPSKESLINNKNYLLNQINEIDNQLTKFEPPAQQAASVTSASNPATDISAIVAAEVQKQLAGLQQQVAAATQSADAGILRAMGEVLPHEDQLWLRDNLAGLPGFLASEDGREVVELLVESYRKFSSK